MSFYNDPYGSRGFPKEEPHFVMCDCGKHGRIILTNNQEGGEIYSKENGAAVVQYCNLLEVFKKDEALKLYQEINKSNLPKEDEEVSPFLQKVIRTWNTAKSHNSSMNSNNFHKMMERLWHYS